MPWHAVSAVYDQMPSLLASAYGAFPEVYRVSSLFSLYSRVAQCAIVIKYKAASVLQYQPLSRSFTIIEDRSCTIPCRSNSLSLRIALQSSSLLLLEVSLNEHRVARRHPDSASAAARAVNAVVQRQTGHPSERSMMSAVSSRERVEGASRIASREFNNNQIDYELLLLN